MKVLNWSSKVNTTQAKGVKKAGTSTYVSRIINGGDKVLNRTFIQM